MGYVQMRLPVGCLIVLSAFCASDASARAADITIGTSVTPSFSNGQLEGCGVTFDVAHHDFEYGHGKLFQITGSINYNVFVGKSPSFTIKLGVKPLFATSEDFSAPHEAYLIDSLTTNKVDLSLAMDGDPGFKLFLFRAGSATIGGAMSPAKTGKITIGYALTPGGLLSVVDVDLKMKRLDVDHPELSELQATAPREWLHCVSQATQAAIDRLRKK